MDKKERKMEKSKGKARTNQERAKAWDDLNKKILVKQTRQEALEKENWVEEEDGENMEDVEAENGPVAETVATEAIAQLMSLPESAGDEEEIL